MPSPCRQVFSRNSASPLVIFAGERENLALIGGGAPFVKGAPPPFPKSFRHPPEDSRGGDKLIQMKTPYRDAGALKKKKAGQTPCQRMTCKRYTKGYLDLPLEVDLELDRPGIRQVECVGADVGAIKIFWAA